MKKILILGGSRLQVPAIKEALDRGYYVITCGSRPSDPGHRLSNEYHNVSITDQTGVLKLASELNVDIILAYASESGLKTAATVSEKLGLPGHPATSVKLLTEKDKFRTLQKKAGLKTPAFVIHSLNNKIGVQAEGLNYPLVIKPVDSSGCKGIKKVTNSLELKKAVQDALTVSKKKRVLIEDYIEESWPEITGDGFVYDGKLVFLCLGDHHYDKSINELLAFCTTWPSVLPDKDQVKVRKEVELILQKAGYRNGPVNIDARIDQDGDVCLLEVAPRNGGNFIPQLLRYATGFHSITSYLDLFEGKSVEEKKYNCQFVANYILHSRENGFFEKIYIPATLNPYIINKTLFIKKGDYVESFKDLGKAIGIISLKFENREDMIPVIHEMDKCVKIKLSAEQTDRHKTEKVTNIVSTVNP